MKNENILPLHTHKRICACHLSQPEVTGSVNKRKQLLRVGPPKARLPGSPRALFLTSSVILSLYLCMFSSSLKWDDKSVPISHGRYGDKMSRLCKALSTIPGYWFVIVRTFWDFNDSQWEKRIEMCQACSSSAPQSPLPWVLKPGCYFSSYFFSNSSSPGALVLANTRNQAG